MKEQIRWCSIGTASVSPKALSRQTVWVQAHGGSRERSDTFEPARREPPSASATGTQLVTVGFFYFCKIAETYFVLTNEGCAVRKRAKRCTTRWSCKERLRDGIVIVRQRRYHVKPFGVSFAFMVTINLHNFGLCDIIIYTIYTSK